MRIQAQRATAVDWRPYWVTGSLLAAALALDVWAGNRLWFWYTIVGLALLLFVAGLARQGLFAPPPVTLWGVGLAAALHYVGGSLSSVRQVGGVNGLYYALPWWDNLTHFLGAGAIALVAAALVRARVPAVGNGMLALVAVSLATLAGVLVELYEFAGFVFFGTIDQGFYTNNTLDLYYNLLGAAAGAFVAVRVEKKGRAGEAPAREGKRPV